MTATELLMKLQAVNRFMLCTSIRSRVCVPEKELEWWSAAGSIGEERRLALEAAADWHRENYYSIPMFDLFVIFGVSPTLRGFEEPRYDGRIFANQWWFDR